MIEKKYKVGIYLRLSKEDELQGESNSISSQREILINYINENNLNFIAEYVDDGISGTTFNRYGFNQMIKDIIEQKINMVVVKDLSRLGRDHIEFGTYVERFFPEHGIRLVALGDMYDSDNVEKNNTTMILFKSMYNEMYVKDISDKIKMSVSNKRKMGQFLGAVAPYGYNKDKFDYHKLVVDEYAANVVRRIFQLFIGGCSITGICRILTNEKIPIPSVYKNLNRGLKSSCYGDWGVRTVADIITNPTYMGNLTQGRLKKVNYKSKKIIHTSKDDWIITIGTCPKIVDDAIFNQAQYIYNLNKNKTKRSSDILLKGLVRCKECDHTIGFRIQKSITKKGVVQRVYGNCNYYLKHRKRNVCTPHNVNYIELERIVLNALKDLINDKLDKNKILDRLNIEKRKRKNKNDIKYKINSLKNDIDTNIMKLDKMYLDKLNNDIDNEMYLRISKQLLEINRQKQEEVVLLEKKINKEISESYREDIELDKYLHININLIANIIDKIVVDENDNIEIYYKICVS